jgi:hypothetical protein
MTLALAQAHSVDSRVEARLAAVLKVWLLRAWEEPDVLLCDRGVPDVVRNCIVEDPGEGAVSMTFIAGGTVGGRRGCGGVRDKT